MSVKIDGVEYSFDCEHCAFHDFMKIFGYDMNSKTCWIDCTKEIKEDIDKSFGIVLTNLHTLNDGCVMYTGNVPLSKVGGLPVS